MSKLGQPTNPLVLLGLEWPCVFVVTCCEGVVPMHHDPDVSEEG